MLKRTLPVFHVHKSTYCSAISTRHIRLNNSVILSVCGDLLRTSPDSTAKDEVVSVPRGADVSLLLQMKRCNPGCFPEPKILKSHLVPAYFHHSEEQMCFSNNSQWLTATLPRNPINKGTTMVTMVAPPWNNDFKVYIFWNTSYIGKETVSRLSCIQNQGSQALIT